ncbi:MAG: protein kinase, partial [Myxococcota bacterium]|nr:protein kinase [Myxococcota bacterium]
MICAAPLAERRSGPRPRRSTMRSSRDQPPYDPNYLVSERYRIIEPMVRGITGWLFRARDEKLGIQVALKSIFPNLVQTENEQERLLRTIKRATKVQHPNVARVYEDGRDKGHLFYTMPYLEGLTLRKIIDLRLERGTVFSPDEIMPLFGQLALAVDRLGSFGAHGALSPAAVIVLPDMLKVVSLPHFQGLPRRPFVALQMQDNALHYLAPEARREDIETDPRADVYSLAVILGEMLTGQIYGGVGSNWGKAQRYLTPQMRQLFHRALAQSPDERIGTAGSFIDAVAELTQTGEAVVDSGEYPAIKDATISGIGPAPSPKPGDKTEERTALVEPPKPLSEEDTERTEPSLIVMAEEPTDVDRAEKSNVKVRTIPDEDTQESRYIVELDEDLSQAEATHSPTKLYTLPKQSFVAAEARQKRAQAKPAGRGAAFLLGVIVLALAGSAGAYIWRYGWPPPLLMAWLESNPGKKDVAFKVVQKTESSDVGVAPEKVDPLNQEMVVTPLTPTGQNEAEKQRDENLLPRKASTTQSKQAAEPVAPRAEKKSEPVKFSQITPP